MPADIGSDRQWVVGIFNDLLGRNPTAEELDAWTNVAQNGNANGTYSRDQLEKSIMYNNREEYTRRLFKEQLGRDPEPWELQKWDEHLALHQASNSDNRTAVSQTSEALLRDTSKPTGPTQDQEDARDYITDLLGEYGLSGLGDWAWQQIQAGNSPQRVLQDLRKTDEYQKRFAGMKARTDAGFNAISEAEYIAWENSASQLLRTAGLPVGFYDSPDDFARFIGGNVSIDELQSRINDGYLQFANGSAEARQQLEEIYGVGPSQMVAYFLDEKKALPLLQQEWATAQISGAAVRTGYGPLNRQEGERLASLGVDEQRAEQGFGALEQSSELFQGLPGMDDGTIGRAEQMGAAFGGDANARQKIERKGQQRRAAGTGAQSFGIGGSGVAALGRDS